ncbi:hypothetical protein TL08_13865 [Actinoalloteichus hymeniacidonis]|uniref:Uncharacterized protein n=1 Tax=Actinoalloteichus hymeniacidonis TaxID=340345 RepID=A0AAC9MZ13_9PSEU|nr:hypothetical protein TL08_13865 [Actinoalloteichus hymeniacidonis]
MVHHGAEPLFELVFSLVRTGVACEALHCGTHGFDRLAGALAGCQGEGQVEIGLIAEPAEFCDVVQQGLADRRRRGVRGGEGVAEFGA